MKFIYNLHLYISSLNEKKLNNKYIYTFVNKMPELLQRLEDASKNLPKMMKKEKTKAVSFDMEQMVGALKDWFPQKSSVEIIREIRESTYRQNCVRGIVKIL